MNYMEIKKQIDEISNKYSCKGDVVFRTALSTMVDCGQQSFNNEDWFKEVMEEIDERHAKADKNGMIPVITADFERAIMNCAKELAHVNTTDLLMYIQREVWFHDVYGDISHHDALGILRNTVEYMLNCLSTEEAYMELSGMGFDDEDLIALGYENVFFTDEEE